VQKKYVSMQASRDTEDGYEVCYHKSGRVSDTEEMDRRWIQY